MQNLENLELFRNFDYTKTAKMPEGPFCQIGAHMKIEIINNNDIFRRFVVPTKSDSDVILCLQLLSKILRVHFIIAISNRYISCVLILDPIPWIGLIHK